LELGGFTASDCWLLNGIRMLLCLAESIEALLRLQVTAVYMVLASGKELARGTQTLGVVSKQAQIGLWRRYSP
jgi:hypothetical protein